MARRLPHDETAVALGARIREAIEKAGGIGAVAVKLRQPAPTLRSWSLGKARPTNEQLVELAKLARMRSHWLFTGQLAKEAGYNPIAGFGCDLSDEILAEYGVHQSEAAILMAPDDSMEPTINTRERIVIDKSNAPFEKSIYAIGIDGRLFIRRLSFTRKGFKFIPDKKGAETFERHMVAPDLHFIGRVVAVIKKV